MQLGSGGVGVKEEAHKEPFISPHNRGDEGYRQRIHNQPQKKTQHPECGQERAPTGHSF